MNASLRKSHRRNHIFAAAFNMMLLGFVFIPDLAFAATDTFAGTVQTFTGTQLTYVPGLISAICYVAGIGLIANGVFRLKDHADDARSHKITPAIGRLFIGAILVSLPIFASWVFSTASIGGKADDIKFGGDKVGKFSAIKLPGT